MPQIYRIDRPDGTREYTDVPQGTGKVTSIRRDGRGTAERERTAEEHNRYVKGLIKAAQVRAPKLADYLEYLSYLRHNSPVRFDRVMRELRAEDPETWMKLQKYPQFRPLKESSIGLKAGANIMGAAAGLAAGRFGGSAEKWMESTLKDLMKRDRFGPYAEVLGDKASTLPTKTQTYSHSRLGQYLKNEHAEAAIASGKAAKDLASSQSALRAARGTAVVRGVGPMVDVMIGALNPDMLSSAAILLLNKRIGNMHHDGVLSDDEYIEARSLLSQSKFGELKGYLDIAQQTYIKGGAK